MLLQKSFLAALGAASALARPILERDVNYGQAPVRGVNIGGWLVIEPWITPSIFQQFDGSIIGEYTLTQKAPNAEEILRNHWETWTGLGDFQRIANSGFNLVRIPIGYWAFKKYPGDPFIQGAAEYLERAIGWARQTGLKVWIDLHGAPLSQNGYDNSGQRTSNPQWTAGDTVSFTLDIIRMIAEQYGGAEYADVIVGIQLLNEPQPSLLPGGRGALQSYYQQGFDIVRGQGSTPVIISDAFSPPSSWNGFLTGQGVNGAIVDHHEYQVFTNALLALSPEEHVNYVYSNAGTYASGADKYIICGEWTAAMTDCAPALNGYGIGARYDGTYSKATSGGFDTSTAVGSCANKNFIDQWDDYMKSSTRNYIAAQIDVFERQLQGWIFWNFKTESSAEWDLFRLQDYGVWPAFP